MLLPAIGTYLLTVDDHGRMSTNDPIRAFIGVKSKDDVVKCYVLSPRNDVPAIILINSSTLMARSEESYKSDLQDLDYVFPNEKVNPQKKIFQRVDDTEVRNNKIQLTIEHRKKLEIFGLKKKSQSMKDVDNRLVYVGENTRYVIWSYKNYVKYHENLARQLGIMDEK